MLGACFGGARACCGLLSCCSCCSVCSSSCLVVVCLFSVWSARETPQAIPPQSAERGRGAHPRSSTRTSGLLVGCSRCSCRSCVAAPPGARPLALNYVAALAALAFPWRACSSRRSRASRSTIARFFSRETPPAKSRIFSKIRVPRGLKNQVFCWICQKKNTTKLFFLVEWNSHPEEGPHARCAVVSICEYGCMERSGFGFFVVVALQVPSTRPQLQLR